METLRIPDTIDQTDKNVLKSPLLAEVSLKYRARVAPDQMPVITGPDEAEKVLREVWDEDTIELKEEFVILLLNNVKKCLGWSKISSGGSTSTIVDPATIFQVALLSNATSIILAHNHPSGNIEPSKADKNITQKIKKSGEMLGINVEDHIIITANGCISFRIKGIL